MNKIRLLYIEDDPVDARAFLRKVREESLPYEVTLAKTLAEARTLLLGEHDFDLILTDYHLPDGKGSDLFEEIVDIPFVLLTGTLEEQLALRTLARGADDYLVKDTERCYLGTIAVTVEKTLMRKQIRQRERLLTQQLLESEARFRLLVESVRDYAIFMLTPEGLVASWNLGAERIYGWKAGEIVGTHFSKFFLPEAVAAGEPQLELESAAREGRFQKEYRRVRKDGSIFWANVDLSVVKDQEGHLSGFSKVTRDITERKQTEEAEQALRQSEQRFAAFMRNGPGVAFMKDLEGKFVFVSEQCEKLFHKKPSELLGTTVADHFPPETAAVVREADRKVIESGLSLQTVYDLAYGNGIMHCLVHRFPITDQTGRIVLVGGYTIDITERIQAEKKLEAALKNEALLKREIHHRVKNNLQIVISLLHLQSLKVADPSTREILRECQSRTRSIALVYALLSSSEDLGKIEFGRYARQLTRDLIAAYNLSAERINLLIHAEEIFMDVDTALPCGLILTELVSNSLKYAFPNKRKGEIEIKVQRTVDGILELTVRDNGIGPPKDFNAEIATTLGFKLLHDLVRQLDGTLKFQFYGGMSVTVAFPQEPRVVRPYYSPEEPQAVVEKR